MARVRSSNNGATVGMVVFGVAAFIFLLLSIILYSQIGKAQQEQQAADQELRTVITAAEDGNATLAEVKAREGGGTVVGKLLAEIEDLRNQKQSLEADNAQATTTLTRNQTELTEQAGKISEAQAAQLASVQAKSDLEAALRAEVDGLTAKVDAVAAENSRLNKLIDDQIRNLDGSSKSLFDAKQAELDGLAGQLASADEENRRLKTVVDELRGAVVESPAITLPDARVVTQNTSEKKVFLDIGHAQGLRLGMAFNVFDPDDLVKISDADAQGKAIVEIINVEENSSVGRVVRNDARTRVDTGDVLVNVVYDPNRVFSFHVFGQFDLDYDGKVGLRDHETIETIVSRSNGRLADALSFDTDYLVLGIEPEFPDKPDDELDLVLMREYRVQLENFQAYQDLLGKAMGLGIPVLNQSRFLDLVGYFDR